MKQITVYPSNGNPPYTIHAGTFKFVNTDMADWQFAKADQNELIININNVLCVKIDEQVDA